MKIKKYILFTFVFTFTTLLSSVSFASTQEEVEDWENKFETCVKEKKDISILISVDTSGSMNAFSGLDPNGNKISWLGSDNQGFRFDAVSTLLYNLQLNAQSSTLKETKSLININTFATTANQINGLSGWIDLKSSKFTLESIEEFKDEIIDANGATNYILASKQAVQEFSSSQIGSNSCKLWIFISDGEPIVNGKLQSLTDIKNEISQLQSQNVFIYGINLFNPSKPEEQDVAIKYMEQSFGTDYDKSVVVKSDGPRSLIGLFSRIALQSSGNTSGAEGTSFICVKDQNLNEDCYFDAVMRRGLTEYTLLIEVEDGRNKDDICLEIVFPNAMNINDKDKQICSTLIETTYDSTNISFEWTSQYTARLNIKFSNSSDNWLNLWRFALKAENPDGRTVKWRPGQKGEVIPKFQDEIVLQYEVNKCVEITYNLDKPPIVTSINFIIQDAEERSNLLTLQGEKTNRGHRVCFTPKVEEIPNEIYILTDIKYEAVEGEPPEDADPVTSKLIFINEPPTHPTFECKKNLGEIKVKSPEVFECIASGGTNASSIEIQLSSISTNSTFVMWEVKIGEDEYETFSAGKILLKLSGNEEKTVLIKATPNESANNLVQDYKLIIESSIDTSPSAKEIIYDELLTLQFKDVPISQRILYTIIYFIVFLLISYLPTVLYSYLKNVLIYSDDLRLLKLEFNVQNENIQWANTTSSDSPYLDLSYLDSLSYGETIPIFSKSKKRLVIFDDEVSIKSQMFPLFKKPETLIESESKIINLTSSQFINALKISPSINSIWYVRDELTKYSLILCINNQESLKDSVEEVKQFLHNNLYLLNKTSDNSLIQNESESSKQPDDTIPPQPDDTIPPQPDDTIPPQPDDTIPPQPDDTIPPQPDDTIPPQPDK
jgi:hypothetical protein